MNDYKNKHNAEPKNMSVIKSYRIFDPNFSSFGLFIDTSTVVFLVLMWYKQLTQGYSLACL